jgi:hypothetical protein
LNTSGLQKVITLKNGSVILSIYFLNIALLLVVGELPSVIETSLSLAGALLSTAGSFLYIVACTRKFKFLWARSFLKGCNSSLCFIF